MISRKLGKHQYRLRVRRREAFFCGLLVRKPQKICVLTRVQSHTDRLRYLKSKQMLRITCYPRGIAMEPLRIYLIGNVCKTQCAEL